MNNQDPPGYLAPCCPEQSSDKERKFEAKPLIKCTIYMNNYFALVVIYNPLIYVSAIQKTKA